MSSVRLFFIVGSALGGLAVAAGAFGAHGLDGRLDPEMLDVFATAARYHMYHALALLAVAWAVARWPDARLAACGWLLTAGVVVFSGSLYLLALTGVRWLGAVTPVGGVLLIAGWVLLAWRVLRNASEIQTRL
jgi:uncharacterized membrane protein YgdD (TMEM256/DUF423 family)